MKRLFFVCGAFAMVALSLLACGESGTSPPPGGYSEEARPTVEALAIERLQTAQAYDGQARQAELTRQAAEANRQEADRQAQQRYLYLTTEAQMTAEAHRRELEQQQQWATQQAANATQVAQATAQAVAVAATSQAVAIEATAQQRALEATATAEALNRQGTATAQARADAATATAQAAAWQATVTRQAWEGKVTATSEVVQATAAAYAATATRAQEKREVVLGYGRDYGIPVMLFALVICGGIGVFYLARTWAKRPIVYKRSLLGDAQPMAIPREGGGYTFVDLDRQPGPALQIGPGGEVNAPLLRSAGQEERTTARDQAVDGMTRPKIGGGGQSQAPNLPAPPVAPAPGLRSVRVFRRLDQVGRVGLLPPSLVAAIEADWQEQEEV
jgi:hypothetical protein